MTKRPPFLVREAVAALSRQGHVADIDLGRRHFKIFWIANGHRHLLVISKTPGDYRACANSRANLKRILRAAQVEGARP
jgi:hypothetical protein